MSCNNERCRGCDHYYPASDPNVNYQTLDTCQYILDTKKRRPCPADENCTEYEPRLDRSDKRSYTRFLYGRRL